MKKSEFIRRHVENGTPDHLKEAEMAARLAAVAGVQWDPEEPELPERIVVEQGIYLVEEGNANLEDGEPIYIEAAARYNAWSRLMNDRQEIGLYGVAEYYLEEERKRAGL